MKASLTTALALGLQLLAADDVKAANSAYQSKLFDFGNSTSTMDPGSASARPSLGALSTQTGTLATQTSIASLNGTHSNPTSTLASFSTTLSRSSNITTTRPTSATAPLKSEDPVASSVSENELNPDNSGAQQIYNLANMTCKETSSTDADVLWESLEGDRVYGQFQKMLSANSLVCSECFGMSKDMCKSEEPDCAKGLADLAKDDDDKVRWDRGLARFAKDADLRDLICELKTGGTCSAPPSCEASQGPGAWILLKSLTTIYSFFNTVYDALGEARTRASTHMELFSSTFAPLPDVKEESMMMVIMTSIGCGLLGFIPGAGGILAGMGGGVGSGIVMESYFMNQPKPAKPEEYLQAFTDASQSAFKDIAEGLLRDGEYTFIKSDGSNGETLTLRERMGDGVSLDQSSSPKDFFDELVPNFERILLQQLVLFTWQNMQTDDKGHIPFIAFDEGPCDKVNHDDENSLAKKMYMDDLKDLDNGYTYEDKCYYLLDGKQSDNEQANPRNTIPEFCSGDNALPGGTNKDLREKSDQFAGLSLADFIEPAVKAWVENEHRNDYKPASDEGNLVSSPRDAGAVRIPVCDYVKNPESPGVDCPQLSEAIEDKKCQIFDKSTGTNENGEYQEGYCKLHFKQYQKNQGNEVNPFNEFQLEVTIFDDSDRVIGQASKQRSGKPIEITDTTLPFNVIAWTDFDDENPVEFWYSDQYWRSDDEGHHCSVGKFDDNSHAREGDCGFQCNLPGPNNPSPKSATEAHKLPDTPKTAVGGATAFVNTFRTSVTATASPTTSTGLPEPTYARGACGVHVRQFQKNDEGNGIGADYQLEVTLYDGNQNAIGASGKAVARQNEPLTVEGLVEPFNLFVGGVDDDPISFAFGDLKWDSKNTEQQHSCSVGKYVSGSRGMDCGFSC